VTERDFEVWVPMRFPHGVILRISRRLTRV
jgi:hypothetical protein